VKRRAFIALLGGAAAWPLAARAQQPSMPVIGFLNSAVAQAFTSRVAAYRRGLGEAGFVEDKNVAIEYRWANGQYDRLQSMAADFVSRRVAVITAGGPPAAIAAKMATSVIPIVFTTGDDPVRAGLVPNLNRPGGNVTGVHLFLSNLSAKKLGLLRDLLPQATVIAGLFNFVSQSAEIQEKELQAAGNASGLRIEIAHASNDQEIESAFATFSKQQISAVMVGSDPYYISRREKIIALAARYAIPAFYELRDFVDDGGLMSYGTDIEDGYRQAGVYAGRILKGEKPGDLPVLQSTKFQFVINLKTVKALGLSISDNLLTLADEVIE
jgi:putative tryptophan/tyrosine transport system substrate-binding protein